MSLIVPSERARELARSSPLWPSLVLEPRHLPDLELLIDGSFSPLSGYMSRAALESCTERSRLPDGTFWPLPVTLDVPAASAQSLEPGSPAVLREPEGGAIAVLHVDEKWPARDSDRSLLAGRLDGLRLPHHYDFTDLRRTPYTITSEIARRGWRTVIALQTVELLHPADVTRSAAAASAHDAGLLLQAVVASEGPVDERQYAQVRCHRVAAAAYPAGTALLTLLPHPACRGADARSMALRAIVARNCGCTHMIVDDPDTRRVLSDNVWEEIGIVPIPGGREGAPRLSLEELASRLAAGHLTPDVTFPEVIDELRRLLPPPAARGVTVFFTGLSGSGKSTIANALRIRLLERGDRRVTLLDGDLVRQHLSSELGFSREHRELNIRRIGFVAAEITRHGGVAICAPIAPFDATRRTVRRGVEAWGTFVLVFVDTPLEECERRDPKGLYARARVGAVQHFTGVSNPYEPPVDAEIVIRTTEVDVATAAATIIEYLEREGYIPSGSTP